MLMVAQPQCPLNYFRFRTRTAHAGPTPHRTPNRYTPPAAEQRGGQQHERTPLMNRYMSRRKYKRIAIGDSYYTYSYSNYTVSLKD